MRSAAQTGGYTDPVWDVRSAEIRALRARGYQRDLEDTTKYFVSRQEKEHGMIGFVKSKILYFACFLSSPRTSCDRVADIPHLAPRLEVACESLTSLKYLLTI
jgi:hypothetical protein